ncbi:hypothetical protein D3C86_1431680 [compost metagenome]
MQVAREAAQAVAAHLGLGAVGVDHAHPEVGHLGGQHEQEAVRADPEVAIAKRRGEGLIVEGGPIAEAVDDDEVVARPLHLGK